MNRQVVVHMPKPRSDAARALADSRYRNRIVRDKKKYSRKGKNSSKNFGESSRTPFSPRVYRELIEIFLQHINQRKGE